MYNNSNIDSFYMPRIPVDLIYMQMAYQIAKLSYAKRRRVGCIIVKDTQVISTGYNGTPHGFENACEEVQVREIENTNHKKVTHDAFRPIKRSMSVNAPPPFSKHPTAISCF